MKIARDAALIVIDVQHGFITERDELPVADGAAVLPVINSLLPRFRVRAASQDWHPANHGSFARNHPGKKPFEMGTLGGQPQMLWPAHCVARTRGAALHEALLEEWIQAIFRKGMNPDVDSYSAFADNCGASPTGLDGYLRAHGVRELFLVGLAEDYCVKFTALDARRLLPDCAVYVIADATRPVDARTGEAARRELAAAGVRFVRASELE